MTLIKKIQERLETELRWRRTVSYEHGAELPGHPSLFGSHSASTDGSDQSDVPAAPERDFGEAGADASLEGGAMPDGQTVTIPEPIGAVADAESVEARNLIFRTESRSRFVQLSYGTPLDSRPDGKIVVFGLPKSGNVWLVSLLCDYTGLPPIHPILDVDRPGVGMCHLCYQDFMANRVDFLHAVYLVRDIRDIIVSYYHESQTPWFQDDMPNFHYQKFDDFYFEWFLTRVVQMHQIHTHADPYLSFGVPVIRYERLYDEPERELARLVKRLGLPYDEDRIRWCVDKNRIEKLRANGRMLNVMVPPSHFRKGGYGNYKSELPKHIRQHATREFSKLIIKWGYGL